MNNGFNVSVFLTGGTGFFGKSILSMFKRGLLPGIKLTILARNIQRFLQEYPEFAALDGKVDFIAGDVRYFKFPERHFDYVFHAATPALEMPPGEARDIIIRGTQRVLAFASHCGAKRLIFISSGAVYGNKNSSSISETFPCKPVTEYGIAKLDAENMCLDSNIETVIARGFAFTGYYLNRNIHFAIGNFIADCLAGRDIIVKGDGTPVRSYLYADDMVKWLFAILFNARAGAVFNVGSNRAVSILTLAQTVKKVLNSSSEIKITGIPDASLQIAPYVPDISRFCKEFNLSVSIQLEDAIRLSAQKIFF